MEDEQFTVPLRADGTQKVFWFDPEGKHVIYRHRDGTLEAIGWECRHRVQDAGTAQL